VADCQHCNERSGSVSVQHLLIRLGPLYLLKEGCAAC